MQIVQMRRAISAPKRRLATQHARLTFAMLHVIPPLPVVLIAVWPDHLALPMPAHIHLSQRIVGQHGSLLACSHSNSRLEYLHKGRGRLSHLFPWCQCPS